MESKSNGWGGWLRGRQRRKKGGMEMENKN